MDGLIIPLYIPFLTPAESASWARKFELAGRGCTIRDNVAYYVVELCNEVLCRSLLVSPPLRDALTTGLRNRWQTILLNIEIISRCTPAAEMRRPITI